MIIFTGWLVLTSFSGVAFGYLDPGTGSMLVSGLVGLFATALFFLKGLYYKVKRVAFRIIGKRAERSNNRHDLVFYSEGRQYWGLFKPVIQELLNRRVSCVYLTSDEADPGLEYTSELLRSHYIGAGIKAYAYLQVLEANLCVMTTPGLDVLQIKRSRGVEHYAHLIHAPTDISLYKTFSFDYYDSVLVNGDHQIQSIRKLEELRGTSPKQLFKTGCVYYDEMIQKINGNGMQEGSRQFLTVMVAPTWGSNGLLRKFGSRILTSLLEQQYRVILRPHPQSRISESAMLKGLRDEFEPYGNLLWDEEPDGLNAMSKADILISDLSGVIFDFAFLFQKPVISLTYALNTLGLEAADLPWDPWELTVLNTLGRQITEMELDTLTEILEQEIKKNNQNEEISSLRDQSIANFGNAAKPVANVLLQIRDEINAQSI